METVLKIFITLVFILEITQIIVIFKLFYKYRYKEQNKIEKINGRSSFTKNQKRIIKKLDEIIDKVND